MVFSGPGSCSGSPAESSNHSASAEGGSPGSRKIRVERRDDLSINTFWKLACGSESRRGSSGNISDNRWADDSRQRNWQFAPDLDGHAVFRISRTDIRHRPTISQPV